jgi:hypothetical protein
MGAIYLQNNACLLRKTDDHVRRLKKLQGWLEKIRKLDFYGAALAEEAAERLRACEALLDRYAQQAFDAHDENR